MSSFLNFIWNQNENIFKYFMVSFTFSAVFHFSNVTFEPIKAYKGYDYNILMCGPSLCSPSIKFF